MVAILGGFTGFLTLLIVGKLSQRFPQLTVVGYAGRLLGRPVGKVVGVLLAGFFTMNAAVDLRVMLRSTMGVYFTVTPMWVVEGSMVIVALSLVWFGIINASRVAPLILVAVALSFLYTFPLLVRWLRPGYLSPLLDISSINPYGRNFWVTLGSHRSSLFLVALMPYIQEPSRAVRTYAWGFWAGWLAVFLAVVAPVMVFSAAGAAALNQPFPEVLAIIRLANFPVERLEMLARLGFNLSILMAVATSYFCSGLLLSEVFETTRMRPFMLLDATLSMMPLFLFPGSHVMEGVTAAVVIATMIVGNLLYAVLWLAYWLRGSPADWQPPVGAQGP